MKEFNLEAAKNGAPVQTRDGEPVRLICYDLRNDPFTIVGLVTDSVGIERCETYTSDWYYNFKRGHSFDLVMAPVKKEGYIVLFRDTDMNGKPNGNVITTKKIFHTKEKAEKAFAERENLVIDIQHIEWEE